ncbi:MAG TPA: MarR family winged helix-turn-helix transcriptional regulator [Nocardioidaceae bacterium]|jgi:DNA-binding MarR family transcriptional regulator
MTVVKGSARPVPGIDAFEPKHMGFLLDRTMRRMRHDLYHLADAEGIIGRYEPLRPSSFRLLSLIPAGGARVTDLAARASMTKQALGQFVDMLEPLRYVESNQDPADRRSRIITRTPLGDEAVADVNHLYELLDDQWRDIVGPRRWATFRAVMLELAIGWEES